MRSFKEWTKVVAASAALLVAAPLWSGFIPELGAITAEAASAGRVTVIGNTRVEPETIAAYIKGTPGRPLTYGTTEAFLVHFGLEAVTDLPGVDDLKAAGFLEGAVPPGFRVPVPNSSDTLMPDEDPLTELDFQDYEPLPPED